MASCRALRFKAKATRSDMGISRWCVKRKPHNKKTFLIHHYIYTISRRKLLSGVSRFDGLLTSAADPAGVEGETCGAALSVGAQDCAVPAAGAPER